MLNKNSLALGLFLCASTQALPPAPGGGRGRVYWVRPGERLHQAAGDLEIVDRSGRVLRREALRPTPVRADGWVTTSYWDLKSGQRIREFRSTWEVPPPPANQGGQLIYLFNGITSAPHTAILQPVLQWGTSPAGGGAYWAVGSWYVTTNAGTYHSTLTRVEPGQTLVGVMTATGQGPAAKYESYFEGIASSHLPIDGIAPLTMLGETLEAYGTRGCDDYPPGFVSFRDIVVKLASGVPNLNWGVRDTETVCGQTTYIVDNSPTNGEIRILVGR